MSFLNPTKPANWAPIDDAAKSGRLTLVSNGRFFVSAAWNGLGWFHASGRPIGFEPTSYLKREAA